MTFKVSKFSGASLFKKSSAELVVGVGCTRLVFLNVPISKWASIQGSHLTMNSLVAHRWYDDEYPKICRV